MSHEELLAEYTRLVVKNTISFKFDELNSQPSKKLRDKEKELNEEILKRMRRGVIHTNGVGPMDKRINS